MVKVRSNVKIVRIAPKRIPTLELVVKGAHLWPPMCVHLGPKVRSRSVFGKRWTVASLRFGLWGALLVPLGGLWVPF